MDKKDNKQNMQQPWTGKGLPPAGTVCEIRDKFGSLWLEITVLYCSHDHIIYLDQSLECHTMTKGINFRPIRTPEQIKAERREFVIEKFIDLTDHYHSYREAYEIIYDAILAGKIEGVKIED